MKKGKLEELADLDYHEPVGDNDPDRENKLKAHMDSTKRSLRQFMEGETAAVAKKKAETVEGAQEVKRLSNISFGKIWLRLCDASTHTWFSLALDNRHPHLVGFSCESCDISICAVTYTL